MHFENHKASQDLVFLALRDGIVVRDVMKKKIAGGRDRCAQQELCRFRGWSANQPACRGREMRRAAPVMEDFILSCREAEVERFAPLKRIRP